MNILSFKNGLEKTYTQASLFDTITSSILTIEAQVNKPYLLKAITKIKAKNINPAFPKSLATILGTKSNPLNRVKWVNGQVLKLLQQLKEYVSVFPETIFTKHATAKQLTILNYIVRIDFFVKYMITLLDIAFASEEDTNTADAKFLTEYTYAFASMLEDISDLEAVTEVIEKTPPASISTPSDAKNLISMLSGLYGNNPLFRSKPKQLIQYPILAFRLLNLHRKAEYYSNLEVRINRLRLNIRLKEVEAAGKNSPELESDIDKLSNILVKREAKLEDWVGG